MIGQGKRRDEFVRQYIRAHGGYQQSVAELDRLSREAVDIWNQAKQERTQIELAAERAPSPAPAAAAQKPLEGLLRQGDPRLGGAGNDVTGGYGGLNGDPAQTPTQRRLNLADQAISSGQVDVSSIKPDALRQFRLVLGQVIIFYQYKWSDFSWRDVSGAIQEFRESGYNPTAELAILTQQGFLTQQEFPTDVYVPTEKLITLVAGLSVPSPAPAAAAKPAAPAAADEPRFGQSTGGESPHEPVRRGVTAISPGAPANAGGIDMRTMNIIAQPMGSFVGLDFRLPLVKNAERIDLDKEFAQIRLMVERGISPSGQRIKEFIAACWQRHELDQRLQDVMACLVDVCRLEEENFSETSPQLRECLVIVDSGKIELGKS
jgi:hypothetical protein